MLIALAWPSNCKERDPVSLRGMPFTVHAPLCTAAVCLPLFACSASNPVGPVLNPTSVSRSQSLQCSVRRYRMRQTIWRKHIRWTPTVRSAQRRIVQLGGWWRSRR